MRYRRRPNGRGGFRCRRIGRGNIHKGVEAAKTMVKSKKVVAAIIGALFLICLGSLIYLSEHYAYTCPEHPQPEYGRIYALNVHSTIVYLTKQEESQIQWLWYGLGALLAIAAFYTYRFHPFDRGEKTFKRFG